MVAHLSDERKDQSSITRGVRGWTLTTPSFGSCLSMGSLWPLLLYLPSHPNTGQGSDFT